MLEKGFYLISTPIGNLSDITLRALEALENVDILYAEDTRVTLKLLNHYEIKRKLFAYYEYNEEEVLNEVKRYLDEGLTVGYVSDAGTPGINDPGYGIVKNITGEHKVYSIPGPSAFLTALTSSGLPVQPFVFIGFLDRKKEAKEKVLKTYKDLPATLIFYERKDRIIPLIKDLHKLYGNRKAVVARELTKKFETIYSFNLGDNFELDLKGEFVLLVEGSKKRIITDEEIIETLKNFLKEGYTNKEAIVKTSEVLEVAKNKIYQLSLKEK